MAVNPGVTTGCDIDEVMIPILLLYFLRLCVCQQEPLYAINFDSQVELCDSASESFVDVSSLRADRFNETTAFLDGHIEFLKEIGHNTMIEIILEKESSGRYEVAATHEIHDFCDEVAMGSETIYYSYLKYMSAPEQCPFEPGKYQVKEMIISDKEMPANSSTCGRYRVLVSFFNIPNKDRKEEKELMFCLSVKTVIEMV